MIEKLALPILHAMDAEKAHDLTMSALKSGVLTRKAKMVDPMLSLSLFGRVFPNPIGLAAGFDKMPRRWMQCWGMDLDLSKQEQ